MAGQESETILTYVGTYTRAESHVAGSAAGIYVFRLNPSTGALDPVQSVGEIINPSFVAPHPRGGYLYAVNEVNDEDGHRGGAISAYAIDRATGTLSFLNRQPSGGTGPCHLTVDATGHYVLVANYAQGSVAALPIGADGRLAGPSDVVQHVGSSVNPNRQAGPHAHSINLDPANRFALVADLGLDKILIYRLDLVAGKLRPNDPPFGRTHAGAGPRHLAFHPSGRYVYVINELDSTMTTYTYDAERGALEEIQNISTVPAGFTGTNWCADVHVARSGRFVYGSNRGHDSIVIFAVDDGSGKLTAVGHESTQGRTPRNFAIAPNDRLLLAANQDTHTIVAYEIDQTTGRLTPTGAVTEVPTPVCIRFA